MSEKRDSVEFRGRRKIYTDVDKVTRDNVIYVLRQSLIYHNQNKDDVTRLISFEKGNQPLMREKSVRKDIDIKSISNLAHQITEFWLGYFWGNHMAFVQKSDKHPKGSKPEDNDSAITLFPTIRRGSKGEAVRKLQQALLAQRFKSCEINGKKKYLAVDGDFGSITETILKRWQSYKGLKVDGVCGPKTWASLGY